MNLHFYTAVIQPATRYVDRCGPKPMRFTQPPHRRLRCRGCRRVREARNLVVQCFYDQTNFWCKDGCKG